MLKLTGVQAGYGRVVVLKDVSIEVREGEIVTLIGANGAGKTTSLMTICGFIRPTSGSITFCDVDITQVAPQDIVRLGLVQSPEGRRIFARMTVRENLEMGAFTRRDHAAIADDTARVFHLFPILEQRAKQRAGTLSGGEQQMLAMGRAMLTRPKLLILDEPSLGLAPLIIKRVFEIIAELHRSGVTILLVEQNANMALKLASRGYVMETGKVTMEGQSAALLADPRVRQAYLGEG